MDFFWGIFLCCCTSTHRDETFLLLSKFNMFSRSEKSWREGQDNVTTTTTTTTRTTTNNEQQTSRTIIIPRQDTFRILGLTINHSLRKVNVLGISQITFYTTSYTSHLSTNHFSTNHLSTNHLFTKL